jgi:hypothetical protein
LSAKEKNEATAVILSLSFSARASVSGRVLRSAQSTNALRSATDGSGAASACETSPPSSGVSSRISSTVIAEVYHYAAEILSGYRQPPRDVNARRAPASFRRPGLTFFIA